MPKKTATAAAAPKSAGPKPCAHGKKKTTVAIYNPWKNRMVRVNPYSANAKKLYKYYIKELGYDPAWIAPADLKFYADSGPTGRDLFRRVKPKPEPKLPPILSSSSYKSYLACHTLSNLDKVMGYAGFDLFMRFKPLKFL